VKVLCGEVAGEPDMLGIETASVIEAWSRLKLRREPAESSTAVTA
jgi:hypothetical protein